MTLENLCKEETSNTVISHPYPSSIRLCLDDKGLSTHKNSSLGNWKCHLMKLNENFVDFAQEAKEFQSDFQTQSDLSKVVFARTVERDRPFTYVPTKTDLYVQIFRDTRTLNQSDHSKVIYAKLLKGKPCVFPAISRNHSEARITSAEFSSKSHVIFGRSPPLLTTNKNQDIKSIPLSSNQYIPFLDMLSNESRESYTNDSFERLLNKVAPILEDLLARTRSMRRTGAIRGKKPTQNRRKSQLKIKYAQILANLRLKKGKTATTQRKKTQVTR